MLSSVRPSTWAVSARRRGRGRAQREEFYFRQPGGVMVLKLAICRTRARREPRAQIPTPRAQHTHTRAPVVIETPHLLAVRVQADRGEQRRPPRQLLMGERSSSERWRGVACRHARGTRPLARGRRADGRGLDAATLARRRGGVGLREHGGSRGGGFDVVRSCSHNNFFFLLRPNRARASCSKSRSLFCSALISASLKDLSCV